MSDALREVAVEEARRAAHDISHFLEFLGGPAWFRVPGAAAGSPRMITTLLHGNEPSGVLGLTRLLLEQVRPAVDLVCAVISVRAALEPPRLSHRTLTGGRDQNRCFVAPFEGPEGETAGALLALIEGAAPTTVVDLHNTSGLSPAYGVCTRIDGTRMGLVSLWAGLCIHTDLRLNTLMESTDPRVPTVTVECGGARDASSHDRAHRGLHRYATVPSVPVDVELPVLSHPIRVELAPGAMVAYGKSALPGADVTLPLNVDARNFGVVKEGDRIGWIGPGGLDALVIAPPAAVAVSDLFRMEGSELVAACSWTPLMVTTDAAIARNDCLFYVVMENGE